jgi:hypothetical protein
MEKWNLRKELDEWRLHVKMEDGEHALCRFLIALDELRVRLAPSKYPNIEISDEGYLWFNVDTSKGTVEILAFPFGFQELKELSIAVSLPRKAEDASLSLLNKLRQIAENITGAKAFAGFSTREETLSAYRQNKHPQLALLWSLNEMLEMKKKSVFFSYLGVSFSVVEKSVSQIEHIIRDILLKLEEKIIHTRE